MRVLRSILESVGFSHEQFSVLEIAKSSPGRVDSANCCLYGVKIIGLVSQNGNKYPLPVLEEARALYEGAPVFLNHDQITPNDRELHDHVGTLHNIQPKADGLYGDLHLKPSHEYTPLILEAARERPKEFGLSHSALVETVDNKPKGVVAKIARVKSVDLVSKPATTRGLFESKQEESKMADLPVDNAPVAEDGMAPAAAPQLNPADSVKAGFRDAVVSILDEAGMSPQEKVAKIEALLEAGEAAMMALGTGDNAESKEGVPNEVAVELKLMRQRETARSVLEEVGMKADPDILEAMAGMNSKARMKQLALRLKSKEQPARPQSSAIEHRQVEDDGLSHDKFLKLLGK